MEDLSYYIDQNTLKVAKVAKSIGDIECAVENYTKVLEQLEKIDKHSQALNELRDEIRTEINELEPKNDSEKILLQENWLLSKSSFVKGKQCRKQLYLEKYKRHLKTPLTAAKKALFAKGRDFEAEFRQGKFPKGVDVKEEIGHFQYLNSYTSYLLSSNKPQVLFEATVIEDDVLVMCDVLTKDQNGKIDVYEIKLNSHLNEAILNDLAIQYTICKIRFGENLRSFNIVLRSPQTKFGWFSKRKRWKIKDMTIEIASNFEKVIEQIKTFKEVLNSSEPEVKMGDHCLKPYECDFRIYCSKSK